MKELFESQNLIINQLKDEVKKLRDANIKLEMRVKKLEEKSGNNLVVQSFDNFSTRLAKNQDDMINRSPNLNESKSEIFKLKKAQDAANDSKQLDHMNWVFIN